MCGSSELTWAKIRIVAADLAKRWLDDARVRANCSFRIRRLEKYCNVFCSSQNAPPPFRMLSGVQ